MTVREHVRPSTAQPMPGDAGLPLLGYSIAFATGRQTATLDRYRRYGEVSWSTAFGQHWVHAEGPEACGAVLQDRDKVFDASGWAFLIGPFFRRGLMLLDGAEHHGHRRIMQEAFTAQRLRGYLDPMTDTISAGLAQWQSGPRHFYRAVKQLTLDVATRTFMADEVGGREALRVNDAFVAAVRAGTAFVRTAVPGGRWARGLAGRRVLEGYLRPRIAEHRAGEGGDLFSALCRAQVEDESFTDDDVVNHMIFLLMAAHDTATITLTTMAYYLARHPEWQERCRAESAAIGRGPVGYDDLDRLVSLDLVMKESLRLVVPVPAVTRRASRDTELLGYHVPAGSYVVPHLWGVHHMPEVWPDPERFDPERFAEHRREDKVHRNAYLPFGNGIHKCIGMYFGGMEVKAVMHQLLQDFRITVPPGYRMPLDWTSLPRPADGLPVELLSQRTDRLAST